MKVEALLVMAMKNEGITAGDLEKLSGVKYRTILNALDGRNVGIKSVVAMFRAMGYQLKAERCQV